MCANGPSLVDSSDPFSWADLSESSAIAKAWVQTVVELRHEKRIEHEKHFRSGGSSHWTFKDWGGRFHPRNNSSWSYKLLRNGIYHRLDMHRTKGGSKMGVWRVADGVAFHGNRRNIVWVVVSSIRRRHCFVACRSVWYSSECGGGTPNIHCHLLWSGGVVDLLGSERWRALCPDAIWWYGEPRLAYRRGWQASEACCPFESLSSRGTVFWIVW